jgi:hypothetical protein
MDEDISKQIYTQDRDYKIVETSHDSSFDTNNKKFFPDKFMFVSDWQINQYKDINIPKVLVEYPIEYTDNDNIELEHRFDFNNSTKIADVAFLYMNNIKYIFEICHKHKTLSEHRPEPWFEFNAKYLIEDVNTNIHKETIILQCIRQDQKCIDCKNHIDTTTVICKPTIILCDPKLRCVNYVL